MDSQDEVVLDAKVTAFLLRVEIRVPLRRRRHGCFQTWTPADPFHADSLRDHHLRAVGETIGIPNLGWYAFRHTYRTPISDVGTPVGVQQKLMRHSDVRTTMNVYGAAYEKSKRRANGLVAGKLLAGKKQPRNSMIH